MSNKMSLRKRKPSPTQTKQPAAMAPSTTAAPIPTTDPQHPTQLLDLPAELLTEILGYLLISPSKLTLRSTHQRRWNRELALLAGTKSSIQKGKSTNILRTCKKLYFAGVEVLYGENKLHFPCFLDASDFLAATGSDRKGYIQEISVHVDAELFEAEGVMDWAKGIRGMPEDLSGELRVVDGAVRALAELSKLKQVDLEIETDDGEGRKIELEVVRFKGKEMRWYFAVEGGKVEGGEMVGRAYFVG